MLVFIKVKRITLNNIKNLNILFECIISSWKANKKQNQSENTTKLDEVYKSTKSIKN